MTWTTAAAITEFGTAIKPTATEQSLIASRRSTVSNTLTAAFGSTSTLQIHSVKVIGSCDRNTVISPVGDVDLLAIFQGAAWPTYQYDSQAFLYRVREALNGRVAAGARGQAVRLDYASGPRVDVAPVFFRGAGLGYHLPKGDKTWILTDPDKQKSHLAQRQTNLGGHLRPLSRLVKAWNRAHSQRFSSFHIEVMVAAHFYSLGGDYREALKMLFNSVSIYVEDPAGYGGDLASARMSWDQQQAAIQSLRSAGTRATNAVAAEARGDHQEAMRLWRIVLGSSFPAYG